MFELKNDFTYIRPFKFNSCRYAAAIDTPMPGNITYDEFIALCFIQMKAR